MTISTMEELEALPPGSSIRVQQQPGVAEYHRGENGMWTRDDHAHLAPVSWIPAPMFAGLVANRRVTDNSRRPPVPGDVYVNIRRPMWHYLITEAPEGGRVHTMRFRDGRYTQDENLVVETMHRSVQRLTPQESPPWAAPVWSVLRSAVEREAAIREEAAEQVRVATARLTEMEEVRANRPGTVWVQVSGTNQVPTEKADGHVPAVAVLETVVARWHATLSLDTRGRGCLCEQVTREWVMQQLGIDASQPSGTFEYERDCGRHT